jgi:epidermal growth factor receptor substrate 15
MAQLIQHKRGRLERLSVITGSLQKGEILIVTGSTNITSSNGSSILFAATESGSVQATNRFIIGSSAPNVFPESTYGGLVNGVPYYDSGSGTLYLLGNNGNTAINLAGNINTFSSSVATSFSASNASIASVTGDFSSSVATSFSASSATLNSLSSSISQSIVDIVSASLSSSLSVIATDIEVAIVSASLSSSQALISSSISSSIAETLSGSAASITTLSSSVSASLATLSASSGFISYVTNSVQNLTGIEVADFDSNTAVTFTNGVLKFIFGTPAVPTSVAASTSGFATDRFNNVNDTYSVNGTWSNQGYTLVSASLYEGATLLTQVGSGTSLTYSTTTSGSHTYRLEYTASSPLDDSLYTTSTTTTGTVSKLVPANPTLSSTPSVQLGYSSNQIEQGATGSISFTSSSANPSNNWNLTSVTTNVATPYYVTGSATGSTSISITATANYASPTGENIPDTTTTSTATTTYTKIRSLRYGASTVTSFTAGELENISAWDTTLGGTIGTIAKGTTTASGQSVTISWTGDKFHYIVFDSARANLTNITTGGFGVFGSFTLTTVGSYKVYKIGTLQAGGAGSSITYVLT